MNGAELSGRCSDLDVVMVGPKSFPPILGGIETHVYEISRRLARRGAKVTVLVPKSVQRESRSVEGVEVTPVFSVGSRYTLKLSMMPSVAAHIRKADCIVHAHDATGGFVAAQVRGKGGFVYTMHGVGFHPGDWPTPFRQGIRMFEAAAVRKARHVFCTDAKSAEYATTRRSQVEILPNGVDSDVFLVDSTRPARYEEGKFVFLFVGRLAKVKGVDILLEAIARIPETERNDAEFVFVGDGPSRGDVLAASKRIPQIRLLGAIPHADIVPYFTHADAFLLPSVSEGLPISLLEAMAASLPCVVTDVGGISSQIPSDSLKLIQPGDAALLSRDMAFLMSDRGAAKALGRRARDVVSKKFSWDRTVDRLVEVYRGIQTSGMPR